MSALDFSKLSVLVVDDVRAVRLVVASLLRRMGVQQIAEAGDGEEALRKLETLRCDAIITDLTMKPMDGIEFTRRLRRSSSGENASVPVVVVSSHSDRAKMQEAVDAGVSEFLLKPIVPWIFTAKLKAVLEKPAQLVTTDGYYGPDRRRRFLRVNNCQRRPPVL
jgi:CheY-like chemotaxis protein